jgi:hypothetical protein
MSSRYQAILAARERMQDLKTRKLGPMLPDAREVALRTLRAERERREAVIDAILGRGQ